MFQHSFAICKRKSEQEFKKMQKQGDTATMQTVKQDLRDHPGVPGDPRFRRQFATLPMHETELTTAAVTKTR